jgi:soluble cytochrome b562
MTKVNFKLRNVVAIFTCLAVAMIFASCGNGNAVDAALNRVEQAMDKVEKNKTSMTADDWKTFNEEMEAPCKVLNEALESNEVGTLKKIKISAVVLRLATVAGEAAMHTVVDSLSVQMQQAGVSDTISNVLNTLQGEEAQKEMQEGMKELQKGLDELQKILK